MKNYENQSMLAHKRRVDAARKAAAIARIAQAEADRRAANAAAMRKVVGK